jgi:hypothetical protein
VREAGENLTPLLALATADLAAGAMPERSHLAELKARLTQVQVEEPERLSFRPDGNDIMRELGLTPGVAVGKVKREMENLILEGTLEPSTQAVLEYLRAIAVEAEGTSLESL